MSILNRCRGPLASLAIAAMTLAAPGHALSASGRVLSPAGIALPGVKIRLALAGLSTSSDASGNWSLAAGPSSIEATSQRIGGADHLFLSKGHLQVRWNGVDASGRGLFQGTRSAGFRAMAPRSQEIPDTLLFMQDDTLLLKDTISASRTGIVSVLDSTFNPHIVYGSLTDSRDGQVYRTVKIGDQTWMARNLNFKTDSSFCYEDDSSACTTKGRLYTWSAAMGLDDSCDVNACSTQVAARHKGVCPTGWHVPGKVAWETFMNAVGGNPAQPKLKAASLWPVAGTDEFGFRAVPSGYRSELGNYFRGKEYTALWSASEVARVVASAQEFYLGTDVDFVTSYKVEGNPLRCLLDD
ncbi:MAG: hypothetical protein RL318_224 [Fibrobacterota bacterium]|jgi:uncharacterized protein (TIGR02145 family)